MSYFLPESYCPRLDNEFFDDTPLRDECQNEVYAHALHIFKKEHLRSVSDIGCGGAFKLIKYFPDTITTGFDLPPTVAWLEKLYPERAWLSCDLTSRPPVRGGLVISADVIEHLVNPDHLMGFIEAMQPDKVVLSTPERLRLEKLQSEWREDGPPVNPCHVREWSYREFYNYVASWFAVDEHFISNETQATQVVVCSLR